MMLLDEITKYIMDAAQKRGIDPDTAVNVAKSEGLGTDWQSNVVKDGQREPSYGEFQLYTGGGMGNDFEKATGLKASDENNRYKMIDFALDQAKEKGWSPWYGARKAGITGMMGIDGAPTPERARFDALVAEKRGMPMSMGSAPDMASDAVSDDYTPGPVENDGIGTDFLRGHGQESALGMRPEMHSGVTTDEPAPSSDPDLQMADAGGDGSWLHRLIPGDEKTKDMGLFERMRQPGNRQAFMRFGAGLAGGATKGWGVGIGAGLEGAADALDRQETLDEARRRTDLAQLGPRAAFASLLQYYKGKGDPNAMNKALIGAYSPESGKFMGMTDERTEAQKNAEYFGEMKPEDPKYAFAPTKAARMTVAEKKEVFDSEDELTNLAQTGEILKRAADINSKTFQGVGAGARAWAGAKLPDSVVPDFVADPETAKNTNEWQNLMGGEAIKTMANTLKGATTDFELGKFVEMLADPETPIDTRASIIARMQQLAIKKNKMLRERVNELRGGDFFRPGGGSSDEPELEDPLGIR